MEGTVFVYARSDSTRLPRKAFLPLGNSCLIELVMRRASCFGLGKAVLLTTSRTVDDELAAYVEKSGYPVVRGDPFDLVKRTVEAINQTSSDFFFRVNGDSPFLDYKLGREVSRYAGKFPLVSNLIERTFPYGVAIEMISSSLYLDYSRSYKPEEAEHVTQHIYRNVGSIDTLSLVSERDDSQASMTIDTKEDYERLKGVFNVDHHSENWDVAYWQVMNLKEPSLKFVELNCEPNL